MKTNDVHPTSVYCFAKVDVEKCKPSLLRLASWVLSNSIDATGDYRAARDLLLRRRPRFHDSKPIDTRRQETFEECAEKLSIDLDSSVLAIQGPPGLARPTPGRTSSVIWFGKERKLRSPAQVTKCNLLDAVLSRATEEGLQGLQALQKVKELSAFSPQNLREVDEATEAIQALQDGSAKVVGGTVWLWAPETAANAADVLVVDEAGQVSLANVLAAAQSAKSIVLLGDPQQLDQPLKGSHPDGADVSALQHLIGAAKTISPEQGLFLEHTWRMHPKLCQFTSEAFYEDRLQSRSGLELQTLEGHRYLNGAGHWFVGVEHHGNQNSSPEEVNAVEALVRELTAPGVTWFNGKPGLEARVPLTLKDILVIAP
jgi:AAA domain